MSALGRSIPARDGRARTVYEALRARIAGGVLAPGASLAEVALSREFGVSRTPVREALSCLAWEGLLERTDRGMRVRTLDPEEVLELYDVRIALERVAASSAALRRSELDLARLRRAADAMKQLEDDAVGRRPELAHGLHFALWTASHNETLIETLERIQVRVRALASTTLHYPERWRTVVREGDQLVEAVAAREPERASEIVAAHLTRARDLRLRIYSRGGAWPADEAAADTIPRTDGAS